MNVLITGAASGIGKAAVDYFISRGHNVYALDVNECEFGEGVCSFSADITNETGLLNVKETLISLRI
jgi:NAD(P)-dependent dehydrogenase (short-subunit alcohol dehydrogenase family)